MLYYAERNKTIENAILWLGILFDIYFPSYSYWYWKE